MSETTVIPEFPGNSHKEKDPGAKRVVREYHDPQPKAPTGDQPPRLEKIVKGQVTRRKKGFFDKFSEAFFGDDTQSVGNFILWDVVIPAIKNTVSAAVQGGVDMLLFGEPRGDRTRRDGNHSIVDYGGFARRPGVVSRTRDERPDPFRSRVSHKFDDIIFRNRGEAEEVLSNLVDQIENYNVATIGDLYDLVGMTGDFTDNKWGWDNLSRASTTRVRDGYILVLPRPVVID